jgi:serine/threonine-protein kinase RsbW
MESRTRATVQLEMPSRLEVLDRAGQLVGQLADVAGFDKDSRLDIQAAMHESMLNAILHGNRGDDARPVTLEIDLDRGGLEMRVRDEGPGFDPTRVPDPLALENLCRSSGRGILLMKALMDEVAFRRPPSGGMEVTMRKRLARRIESGCDPTRPTRVHEARLPGGGA